MRQSIIPGPTSIIQLQNSRVSRKHNEQLISPAAWCPANNPSAVSSPRSFEPRARNLPPLLPLLFPPFFHGARENYFRIVSIHPRPEPWTKRGDDERRGEEKRERRRTDRKRENKRGGGEGNWGKFFIYTREKKRKTNRRGLSCLSLYPSCFPRDDKRTKGDRGGGYW